MAVAGRNAAPIVLVMLIAAWDSSRSVAAADYLHGTIAGWGNLIDPDGDCTFSVSRGGLEIKLGESSHDLDAERGRLNAPRVLRSVDGDYTVQVTVGGRLPLPDTGGGRATAYLSGGLLVWADAENYVRLERASFSRNGQENYYANFEMWYSGRSIRMGLFRDFPLDAERPVQLRLEVRGGEVRGLVRHEGDDWHEMGQATLERRGNLLTGIHSLNTTGQNVTVAFSRLDLFRSFEPEVAPTSSKIKLNPLMRNEPRPTPDTELATLNSSVRMLQERSQKLDKMTQEEKDQLVGDAVNLFVTESTRANQMSPFFAQGMSNAFEQNGDIDLALKVYERFIEGLESLDTEPASQIAQRLKQLAKNREQQLALIGKTLELEGELLGGDKLDWSQYSGKVVLVDFWASWCGPCRQEMPNVLKAYEKYHDSGFEVVGVSLDTSHEAAVKYLEETEIQWPSLFKENAGWKHPMAVRYSVTAIPKAILVGRDGKVISIAARGEALHRLLSQQLPETQSNDSFESVNVATDGEVTASLEYSTYTPGWYSPNHFDLAVEPPGEDWILPEPRGNERLYGTWAIGAGTQIKVVLDVMDEKEALMRFAFDDDVNFRDKQDVSGARTPVTFKIRYTDDKHETYSLRFYYQPSFAEQIGEKRLMYYRGGTRAGSLKIGNKSRMIVISDDNADGYYSDLANTGGQIDLDGDGVLGHEERFASQTPVNVDGRYYAVKRISPSGDQITLEPASIGSIEGVVVGDEALEGVTVELVGHELKTLTNAYGKFALLAPAGRFGYLTARADGYVPKYQRLRESVNTTRPLTVEMKMQPVSERLTGEIQLANAQGYHVLAGTLTGVSGGDFYVSASTGNTLKFFANNAFQRGLMDLGDLGDVDLESVEIPNQGTTRFGVEAIEGHTYAALAKAGEEGHFVAFRVKDITPGKSVTIEFQYR